MMRSGLVASREADALPLPLAGEGWVGVSPRVRLFVWREPPPAALRASTSPASGRGAPSLPPERFNLNQARSNISKIPGENGLELGVLDHRQHHDLIHAGRACCLRRH
jgi:hypothetical protein